MNSPEPKKTSSLLPSNLSDNLATAIRLITIIKAVDKETFENLCSAYSDLSDSSDDATKDLEKIAEFSLTNTTFGKFLEDSYKTLAQHPEKQKLVRFHEQAFSQDKFGGFFKKASPERETLLADPTLSSDIFVKKLKRILKNNGKRFLTRQRDALIMHHFLSPSLTVFKDQGKIKENFIANLRNNDLNQTAHPDAILIFGSHDLNQLEQIQKIYNALDSLGKTPRKIIITESNGNEAIMIQRLKELGIPADKIIVTQQLTNADALMAQENNPFIHILISSESSDILQQVRSYEMQSTYDWQRITTLPHSQDEIKQLYYSTAAASALNIIAVLHKVGKFLDNTVNSDSLSIREAPSKLTLSESMQLFIDYYMLFTNQEVNKAAIVNNFLAFSHHKAEGKLDEKLKMQLYDDLKLMTDYFRFAYNLVKEHQLKQPPPVLVEKEQSAILALKADASENQTKFRRNP